MARKVPRQKRGRSKQDYATPEDFLGAVKGLLGIEGFEWDLAASEANTVVPWHYYGKYEDSLSCSWSPMRGWMWLNPPYANIRPWVQKAYESGSKIAVLVPASTGSNWWRDWVHEKARIVLLNGRITFRGQKDPYIKDLVLLLYGSKQTPGYEIWRWMDDA